MDILRVAGRTSMIPQAEASDRGAAASSDATRAVQRELARLVEAGLVTASNVERQKHYQANKDAPIFPELQNSGPYPLCNATAGGVLAARCAGTYAANAATPRNVADPRTSVSGSTGLTP
jgi:hypothetical protein